MLMFIVYFNTLLDNLTNRTQNSEVIDPSSSNAQPKTKMRVSNLRKSIPIVRIDFGDECVIDFDELEDQFEGNLYIYIYIYWLLK
jgi:hypothetical protein